MNMADKTQLMTSSVAHASQLIGLVAASLFATSQNIVLRDVVTVDDHAALQGASRSLQEAYKATDAALWNIKPKQ